MGRLRVVLADDNVLIRQGVAAIIDSLIDIEVIAECEDIDTLLAAVGEHEPDVVVTDIRMPPSHTDEGIRAARTIREAHPAIGVVVLSQFSEPAYVLSLFEDGSKGLGYILKERVSPGELERAIREVAVGGSVVDSKIIEVLVDSRSRRSSAIDALTPRERDVGLNNSSIAEELVLTPRAISKHINSIFSKLGVSEEESAHRRVKAVLIWLAQ